MKLFFAAACVMFVTCGLQQLTGGTSTSENGRMTGRIVDQRGSGAGGTRVILLPADFDPAKNAGFTAVDTTDSLGNFTFRGINKGEYAIVALPLDKRTCAGKRGIHVGDSDVTLAADTLRTPGSVKVTPPSEANFIDGYLYVPGTLSFALLKKNPGLVTLDSLPADTAADVYYSSTTTPTPSVVRYGVRVRTGDTTTVFNPDWDHAGTLTLNTSKSGAYVTGSVTAFPVLIRLTAGNFDFSQAKSNGADIRFTKPDNTSLPFTIERWDPGRGLAEVWVKVDTVHGNDSTQSLLMYWGNAGAVDGSNGKAVFDTGAGFKGVWHLDESAGALDDATANGYYGTGNGKQQQAPGEIDFAQKYDGVGNFTEMGNVCNPGESSFTVCAWIKLSATNSYQAIISKSKGDAPSSSYGWLVELGADGALVAFMASDTGTWGSPRTFCLASKVYIVDTEAWHHVAVAIDRSNNKNCRLYIDGTDVTPPSAFGDITTVGTITNSFPLRLGADAKGGCPWSGSLDECSLAFTARSTDWIRLCYLNQKAKDALVQW